MTIVDTALHGSLRVLKLSGIAGWLRRLGGGPLPGRVFGYARHAGLASRMLRGRPLTTERSLFSPRIRLETVRQLVRAAQRGGVSAVDFVGGDAQALPGDAAKKTHGEQAVFATDQDPRGGVGPSPERGRFPHSSFGLGAPPLQRLGGQLPRDVLVEEGDVIVVPLPRLLVVSRMCPVVGGRLSRGGDHGRDEDEQLHGHPVADERR